MKIKISLKNKEKINLPQKLLIDLPVEIARFYPNRISHKFRAENGWVEKKYKEFHQDILKLAGGFLSEGVLKEDHVAFFCNNRYEWIITDLALMNIGAVSVPRGSDTTPSEAAFILFHSDSSFLVIEDSNSLKNLIEFFINGNLENNPSINDYFDAFKRLKKIFIIEPYNKEIFEPYKNYINEIPIINYSELLLNGEKIVSDNPDFLSSYKKDLNPDTLVSIIYTSGTTGNPKGVMLNHRNFMQNVISNTPRMRLNLKKGDKTLLILPSWHVFDRAFEYCGLSAGMTFVYSSTKYFSEDLSNEKPDILISVPRIWETVYQKLIKTIKQQKSIKQTLFRFFVSIGKYFLFSYQYLTGAYLIFRKELILEKLFKSLFHLIRLVLLLPLKLASNLIFKPIKEKVGGRLRGAISGGGSLPLYLDIFFNSIGITLLNAYGMTECAPGIISRSYEKNTIGATGTPFANTEILIVDENGKQVSNGKKGVLFVKGPQVMSGYYKNKAATEAVLTSNGWLNTGDLAIKSFNNDIVLVGRMKDTIVLSGGENVEPEKIEDKLKESSLIAHAVVIGQDKKNLAAILAIDEEELKNLANTYQIPLSEILQEDLINHPTIIQAIKNEVNKLISKETGFKPFEKIATIIPIKNKFEIGKELTQSLKIKRKYVEEKYHDLINKIFHKEKGK